MKTIMKTFATLIFLFAVVLLNAQSPQAFNYQAVARNADGNVLPDKALGIRVSLHQNSEAGDVVYSETFTPTTNEFGLFTLSIGTGTVVTGNFGTINWSDYQYWMQVEMDVNGGTSYSNMGTSQLLSVPYSLYSASSVWKKSGTSINYLDGMVGIGTNIPVAVLDITRNNAATNSQLWLSQKGSGDATMGFLVPTSNWSIGIDQNDGGKFKIASSYDASYLTKMTFSKDGNVGIGTTDPISSARLHVTSSSGYAGYFSSDSSSSMTQAVRGQYNGSGATDGVGVYGYSHPVDNYGIGGYFRGGYRGVVGYSTGVGTVYYYGVRGIAETTGAGHTYGVYGSATTNGGTAYGLYCSGSGAYTGTWTDVSDAKFKSNVADYTESALGKIMLLRPVTFTMKTSEYPFMGFETGTQIGFIAQEVKIVFPSLVENEVHPGENHDDPGIEYEGMNYIGLIPVLVKAIQEQQEEIELLKAEIQLLKSK